MGYNTDYTITNDMNSIDMATILYEYLEKLDALWEDNINKDVIFTRGKWYSHDRDMKQFSLLYPEVTFILNGVGEEQLADDLDIWEQHFKNGRIVKYMIAEPVMKEVEIKDD